MELRPYFNSIQTLALRVQGHYTHHPRLHSRPSQRLLSSTLTLLFQTILCILLPCKGASSNLFDFCLLVNSRAALSSMFLVIVGRSRVGGPLKSYSVKGPLKSLLLSPTLTQKTFNQNIPPYFLVGDALCPQKASEWDVSYLGQLSFHATSISENKIQCQ